MCFAVVVKLAIHASPRRSYRKVCGFESRRPHLSKGLKRVLFSMKICEACGEEFPGVVLIDGIRRNLGSRKYCLICSPFGFHNTISKQHGDTSSRLPSQLAPSLELAYLLGVVIGDGNIFEYPRCERVRIYCDSRYPALITKFRLLTDKVLNVNSVATPKKGENCVVISAYKKHIAHLLGVKASAKKLWLDIPLWLEQPLYAAEYIRGLVETDGSVAYVVRDTGSYYSSVIFTSAYPVIMDSFLRAASGLGFNFKPNKTKVTVTLGGKDDVETFMGCIGVEKMLIYKRKRATNER